MSFTINLNPRDATIPISSTTLNINNRVDMQNFIQTLEKEVKALSKKKQKQLKRQLSATITGLLLTFSTTRVMAANSDIVSPDMIALLMGLVGICVLLGVLFAMVCLVIAGIQMMMNQMEQSKTWTTNIIKGLGQVLLAPMIVITIVILGNLLFSGNPYWINPLKFIPAFGN